MAKLLLTLFFVAQIAQSQPPGRGKGAAKGKPGPTEVAIAAVASQEVKKTAVYVGRIGPRDVASQIAPFASVAVRKLIKPGTRVRKNQPVMELSRITDGESYSNYVVRANVSGTLDDYLINPGQEFNAGTPLFRILDTNTYVIDLAVSDKDHVWIQVDDKVQISTELTSVPVAGTVYEMAMTPTAGSGLFNLEVEVSAKSGLRIGQMAKVEFASLSFAGIVIPRRAIMTEEGNSTVFIMTAEQTLERRRVKIAKDFGDTVGIAEGLTAGDSLVTRPNAGLTQGMAVTPAKKRKRGRR